MELYIRTLPSSSMVVARHTHRLRQALVLNRGLQHHALVELRHHLPLDLLPGRLALGEGEAAILSKRCAAFIQFRVRYQDVGRALLEIDADAVSGLDERQSPSCRRLRRSVEDRG